MVFSDSGSIPMSRISNGIVLQQRKKKRHEKNQDFKLYSKWCSLATIPTETIDHTKAIKKSLTVGISRNAMGVLNIGSLKRTIVLIKLQAKES